MKRLILTFALLLVPAWASAQLPYLVESTVGTGTCTLTNVTSGDIVGAFSSWTTSTSTPTVSDSLGTPTVFGQVEFNTANTERTALYIGPATVSGADTITFSVASAATQVTTCFEWNFGGISTVVDNVTVDGYTATVTKTSSNNVTSLSGDLMLSLNSVTTNTSSYSTTDNFMGYGFSVSPRTSGWRILGDAGNHTSTYTNGGSTAGTLVTATFKPTAIQITDPSALPSGDTTSAYSYTLNKIGASAPVTWSVSAGLLPLGLSLNSSTGAITGTPTNSSAGFTIQVTDGTHTTSKAFTLLVGTGQSAVTHVKDSSGAGVFSGGSTSGDTIILGCNIESGRAGNPVATDTLGTPYKRVVTKWNPSTSGNAFATLTYSGIAPSTGANTVACSSGTLQVASEYSNVQNFVDNAVYSTGTSVAPDSITTGSLTPFSTNQLLYATWIGVSGTTWTNTAPCTAIAHSGSFFSHCWDTSTAITGYTENSTTAAAVGVWTTTLIGLRPTITGTAPMPSGNHPRVTQSD
jgi:hypothetical protein